MIPREQWKWFGNPGHFICAQWCRFHLCTQVGRVLVSTVGEFVHPRHSRGTERDDKNWWVSNWPGEDVGCDRTYETTVFRVFGRVCDREDCQCGTPVLEGCEIDFGGYNLRGDAAKGHLELCLKWAKE